MRSLIMSRKKNITMTRKMGQSYHTSTSSTCYSSPPPNKKENGGNFNDMGGKKRMPKSFNFFK